MRRLLPVLFVLSCGYLAWELGQGIGVMLRGVNRSRQSAAPDASAHRVNYKPTLGRNTGLPTPTADDSPLDRTDTTTERGAGIHAGYPAYLPPLLPLVESIKDFKASLIQDRSGRTQLRWEVLAASRFPRGQSPVLPPAVLAANNRPVSLTGFMTPLDDIGRQHSFLLIGSPISCFYCQAPVRAATVHVVLADGTSTEFVTSPVTIDGRLSVNLDQPEDFLYRIDHASVAPAE